MTFDYVQSAGAGALGSFLTAELSNALDIPGDFGGQNDALKGLKEKVFPEREVKFLKVDDDKRPPGASPCTVRRSAEAAFQAYGNPVVKPSERPDLSAPRLSGFEFYGFKTVPPTKCRSQFAADVYIRRDNNGIAEFISCTRPNFASNEACRQFFI